MLGVFVVKNHLVLIKQKGKKYNTLLFFETNANLIKWGCYIIYTKNSRLGPKNSIDGIFLDSCWQLTTSNVVFFQKKEYITSTKTSLLIWIYNFKGYLNFFFPIPFFLFVSNSIMTWLHFIEFLERLETVSRLLKIHKKEQFKGICKSYQYQKLPNN